MTDAFSGIAELVRMTEARSHDRKFPAYIELPANSIVVFDKAYNVYSEFAKWTTQKVWFVARMNDNAFFHVTKVMIDNTKKKNAKGVLKEQYITVGYKKTKGETLLLQLRRITFKADYGKVYVFITNNFKLPAAKVALIYK